MDSIKFIPKSQKNLEELVGFKAKDKGQELIYILFALFILYIIIVVGFYWYFVIQEKNKVTRAIEELDSSNKNYYITDNLEQDLFNIADLIKKNYNPLNAIKSIEAVYVPGASISSLSYNKIDKIITISMKAASLNDVTTQVTAFKNLPIVNIVNLSPVSSDDSRGFSFSVEIILK